MCSSAGNMVPERVLKECVVGSYSTRCDVLCYMAKVTQVMWLKECSDLAMAIPQGLGWSVN